MMTGGQKPHGIARSHLRERHREGHTIMGTAQLQGELWSARARYWALLHERVLLPMFEVVLTILRVDNTTSLLDIGCGTGMFAMLAAARGATVSGLDASPVSIEIARERTPGGAFAIGE